LSKIILLVLAAFGLYLLVKGLGRKASASRRDAEKNGAVRDQDVAEQMVGCAHCGVNLPQSEAVAGNGSFFCSEAHRTLGGS
jgi:uncharacterized protein